MIDEGIEKKFKNLIKKNPLLALKSGLDVAFSKLNTYLSLTKRMQLLYASHFYFHVTVIAHFKCPRLKVRENFSLCWHYTISIKIHSNSCSTEGHKVEEGIVV